MRCAQFERFKLILTKEEALAASHPGACDEDIKYLLTIERISKQIGSIDPEAIRAELKEYGAWDTEELSDEEENRSRILWIAAGNIKEDLYNSDCDVDNRR